MNGNSLALVRALEEADLFDGRYSAIRCVNLNPATGERRGCFSLVFRAYDVLDDREVALKFFDIDPANLARAYRRVAFHREHAILQALLNRERCLQLASALNSYELVVPLADGSSFTVPCQYFAVEWLTEEIDGFFHRQHEFSALEKLRLFNDIVLSVQALHRHEIVHRDLKPDNLRSYIRELKRVIVAIDLGTSARHDFPNIMEDYHSPVGAPAYAPPEAFCHFAGDRTLGPHADNYALGCLLYELFNFNLHYFDLREENPHFDLFIASMEALTREAPDVRERLKLWRQHVGRNCKGIATLPSDSEGSTVPPGIALLLSQVIRRLTHPDFQQRTRNLDDIRRLVWSAIRCLENERSYQRRLALSRQRRRQRQESMRRREERLKKSVVGGLLDAV